MIFLVGLLVVIFSLAILVTKRTRAANTKGPFKEILLCAIQIFEVVYMHYILFGLSAIPTY